MLYAEVAAPGNDGYGPAGVVRCVFEGPDDLTPVYPPFTVAVVRLDGLFPSLIDAQAVVGWSYSWDTGTFSAPDYAATLTAPEEDRPPVPPEEPPAREVEPDQAPEPPPVDLAPTPDPAPLIDEGAGEPQEVLP